MLLHSSAHLLGIVSCEAELARCLAPSIFAAVEVHAPGTAKGEGGTTGVRIFALASAGPAEIYKDGLCIYMHYLCSGIFFCPRGEALLKPGNQKLPSD